MLRPGLSLLVGVRLLSDLHLGRIGPPGVAIWSMAVE
jgi:hypothetical protein